MNKRILLIVVSVVLAVTFSACSSADNKSESKKEDTKSSQETSKNSQNSKSNSAKIDSDACAIFTVQELGQVFGGEFEDGVPDSSYSNSNAVEGSGCEFSQKTDGSTDAMVQSTTVLVEIGTFDNASSARSNMTTAAPGSENEVKGVGDTATLSFGGRLNPAVGDKTVVLYVLQGKQILTISATTLSGDAENKFSGKLVELAKLL